MTRRALIGAALTAMAAVAATVLEGTPGHLPGVAMGSPVLLHAERSLALRLERCGASHLAARARDELVAAGARPRRTALQGRAALTPSELRVAELVALGRTNREVAQALFVTPRTVEGHLTAIFHKLGVTGRDEVAAALES